MLPRILIGEITAALLQGQPAALPIPNGTGSPVNPLALF